MHLDLGCSHADFMANIWQQKPLLIRQGIRSLEWDLSADELAGLACEDDIESRLVIEDGIHYQDQAAQPWQRLQGPFDEDLFAQLPKNRWSLLIQAIDHLYDPALAIRKLFRFIPDWQLDDLMISYATEGGSVGPHYDRYDVFLIQVAGVRNWKIGNTCSESDPLRCDTGLPILEQFETRESWDLVPGDILYLPPGVSHFGRALDNDCMTLSVGFRAPGIHDLLADFSQHLYADTEHDPLLSVFEEITRSGQQHPAELQHATLSSIQHRLSALLADKAAFGSWLGQYLSRPKYPDHWSDDDDSYETLEQDSTPDPNQALRLHNACRLLFNQTDSTIQLFVNGKVWQFSAKYLDWIRDFADSQRLYPDALQFALSDPELVHLICAMWHNGSLIEDEAPPPF